MRSRTAIMYAMRSIQTSTQDPGTAQNLLALAGEQLNAEWRATHPQEELGIQIDPTIWGGSAIYMP
jgi:hypothetical protein